MSEKDTAVFEQEEKRIRKLTESGKLLFQENLNKYTNTLLKIRKELDLIFAVKEPLFPIALLEKLQDAFKRYEDLSDKFIKFLIDSRTDEAENEIHVQRFLFDSFKPKVEEYSQTLVTLIEQQQKTEQSEHNSRHSSEHSSRHSSSRKSKSKSTSSGYSRKSLLDEQMLRLQTAKIKQKYLDEELDLQKQIQKLHIKREVEEAEAAVSVLNHQDDIESLLDKSVNETYSIREHEERVQDYVNQQYDMKCVADKNAPMPANQNVYSDLSQFLLKKDLALTRLSKFDDKPEHYALWKVTFLDVIQDLKCSALQEMDLLVNQLGEDSKKQAISIRTANAHNPKIGLEHIWERLERRYAAPEMVEASIKAKVAAFSKINVKDTTKLYNLYDLVSEINSLKQSEKYMTLFAYFDSASGVNQIVNKLPFQLQEKWSTKAMNYKESNNVSFPPFEFFLKFINDMAKLKNDPSFKYEQEVKVNTHKTDIPSACAHESGTVNRTFQTPTGTADFSDTQHTQICPLHGTNHSLNSCKDFRWKSIEERLEFAKRKGICTKCCGQKCHEAKHCKKNIQCFICKSTNHPTALHVYNKFNMPNLQQANPASHTYNQQNKYNSQNRQQVEHPRLYNPSQENKLNTSYRQHVESQRSNTPNQENVNNSCTAVCQDPSIESKSCAKTVLVNVYHQNDHQNSLRVYAVIDEQSNRTLARSDLFDYFNINGPETPYSLSSCSDVFQQAGRRATGLIIESLDGRNTLKLPTVIECDEIPNDRNEIPIPEVVLPYKHMRHLYSEIPALDSNAKISLLIGRDLLAAHHVLQQCADKDDLTLPYAQYLRLGWVVIGETCSGVSHKQNEVSVYKSCIHYHNIDGRTSYLEPCENNIQCIEENVFVKTKDDDTLGLSVEDKTFLNLMENKITKDSEGLWSMPLPFRDKRPHLPGNRAQALKRANLLTISLNKNPVKKEHVFQFMDTLFHNEHAEIAPPLAENEEHCYLPLFAVYHSKKPDKVRCVFDSSAKCQGLSLNDILITGPDLLNSLLGVLIRFRRYKVAISADIEQMFYRFSVSQIHRNYLRFFWFRDNDINKDLIEYRMKRHVFGNSASPAIAIFGLQKTVENAEQDVKSFVNDDFYVDDGLISVDNTQEAISLLSRTQKILREEGNIRLHKIVSNDREVLNAFSKEDLAKDITSVDLELQETPPQRSLGVSWNISTDTFTFKVSKTIHPYTKRGVLATINSLYDPIGFLAPVIIKGKLIMRDVMCAGLDWDDRLPEDHYSKWNDWCESLPLLDSVSIPRMYADIPSTSCTRRELHIFSDASQVAIAAVAYLKIYDTSGNQYISFVHGKAKVAPTHGHTIPRLELCAAVLATQIKDSVVKHLNIDIDSVTMYTDSQIVLGYINNECRRFYIYVGNRVDRIRQYTNVEDWKYVSTDCNPADFATRSLNTDSIKDITESIWLKGPKFLVEQEVTSYLETDTGYLLIDPDMDKEVRPMVIAKHVICKDSKTKLGIHRFDKFSKWKHLLRGVATLLHVVKSYNGTTNCSKWHKCKLSIDSTSIKSAERIVLKEIQRDVFTEEIDCIMEGRQVPKNSSILSLSPYLDSVGLLRVGGRLSKGKDVLKDIEVNPIIIPKNSHIALLLVRHYHETIQHQGRRITEGSLRSAGYWVVGVKRLITSVIHNCVVCRKLRGSFCAPRMADLPSDRITPGPPFTFVGLDTFGPWNVIARKTRGGNANQKRWAILFTCLVSRAIHIELIEELSSSSFINSLRRFISIRGPVRQFRSDRGTNFIGAVQELGIMSSLVEDQQTQKYLSENNCQWIFNPPHASHFGGVWERMIGVTRRILDAMLLQSTGKGLTHETLSTFLAEVCAIVNSRPLIPISADPTDTSVLTPSMLLTQKVGTLPESLPALGTKDMFKAQWKHVQILAKEFWKKWQKEYIHSLQIRPKWNLNKPNLKEGDIVLLREYDSCRNLWPMAMINQIFPASDGCVREVEVRCIKGGKQAIYVRPVHELIPLLM